MLTHGDGDPAIPPAVQAAHDAAAARGALTYRDPRCGGIVVTRVRLVDQGHCCGVGCRHCPYPREAQAQSGRAVLRPRGPA